ncbi:NADPH-dependent FMN reductase [Schlesneria paludicola]|uniref:NADPH-dependent FMN reductase n=1 Tax=Schlesneria paludicola TaxID=360056 RepID=UPI00029A7059|nr:NAD(P)H-dependent oxidoreductase [Schlesneria paludicola]
MPSTLKILAFAGSVRRDSFNRKLLRLAVAGAEEAGAEVTVVDLRDYPLPIFDQDLEAESGPPENAKALKKLFIEHHALLIASPEYNSSVTPLMKNTIDWVSRPVAGELALAGFHGKVATLISASPGTLGGLRGLIQLRSILGNIGVIVLPEQIAVPLANEAFDAHGALKNERQAAKVKNIGAGLVFMARRFAP